VPPNVGDTQNTQILLDKFSGMPSPGPRMATGILHGMSEYSALKMMGRQGQEAGLPTFSDCGLPLRSSRRLTEKGETT